MVLRHDMTHEECQLIRVLNLIVVLFRRLQRASDLLQHHIANWETCTTYYIGSIMARMPVGRFNTVCSLLFVPVVKW